MPLRKAKRVDNYVSRFYDMSGVIRSQSHLAWFRFRVYIPLFVLFSSRFPLTSCARQVYVTVVFHTLSSHILHLLVFDCELYFLLRH